MLNVAAAAIIVRSFEVDEFIMQLYKRIENFSNSSE